jgi:predicted small metal-binding protein
VSTVTGYNFAGRSVGMPCEFEIRGASSKAEALDQIAAHAKHANQMATILPDLASKVNSAIRS